MATGKYFVLIQPTCVAHYVFVCLCSNFLAHHQGPAGSLNCATIKPHCSFIFITHVYLNPLLKKKKIDLQ